MKKSKYNVRLVIFLLTITLGLSFVFKNLFSSQKKLNVIWISLDTQRAKSLGEHEVLQYSNMYQTNLWVPRGRGLLFNIQKDPDELTNLAEENPELVFKLRNELLLFLFQKSTK